MSYRGALPPGGQAQAFPGQPAQEQRYSPQQAYYYPQHGQMMPQHQQQMQYGSHPGHQGLQQQQQQQQQQFQPQYVQQHHPSLQSMQHQMHQPQIPHGLPNNYGQDIYHNYEPYGQAGQSQSGSGAGQYAMPDNTWEQQQQLHQQQPLARQEYQNVNVMQAKNSQHGFGHMQSPQMRQQQQQHLQQQRQHMPSPTAEAQQLQQQHRPSPQPQMHQRMQPQQTPPIHHRQQQQQAGPPPQRQRQTSNTSQRQASQQPPTPTYQQNTPSPMPQQLLPQTNQQNTSLSQHRPIPTPPPPVQQLPLYEERSEPPLVNPESAPPPPAEEVVTVAPSALHQSEFVSLQDIQTMPPLPPLPTIQPHDLDMDKSTSLETPGGKPLPSSPDPLSMPNKMKQEKLADAPILLPKTVQPRSSLSKPKVSPHSSVSGSPATSARSPSITKRSPMPGHKAKAFNLHLMVSVAEECLAKARKAVHDVAMDRDQDRIDEYQKLIGTGLACLEAALQPGHSKPREEARLRLRYAAIIHEETDDLMQAETTLSKGVSLCEQHRLLDLKYCTRYQMLQVLFDRSHKAALTAVDKQISDCEAYKHVHWSYAFRLLKASFYMAMGSSTDTSAFENLRGLHAIATKRGDNALCVYASLLEGLAHLRTSRDDCMEKVRDCIAQAAKHQFDESVQITQLEALRMFLDVAATLHRENPDMTAQKLRVLQNTMDEREDWSKARADFLIPVKKQPAGTKTISEDTAAILRSGVGETDHLVVSFMTKMEFNALVFTLSGIISMHKSSSGHKSNDLWGEGLKILNMWDKFTKGVPYGSAVSLKTAISQREWRVQAQAYLYVLIGLDAASHCQWTEVRQMLDRLDVTITPSTNTSLRLLSIYLRGVYHQGTADLQAALSVFSSKDLDMPAGSGAKAGQGDIALLAAMNRVWIMQHPSFRDDQATFDLLEQLEPICSVHPMIGLRTAWNNIMATITTEPPQLMNRQKQHLQDAMSGVRITSNVLEAAITLCIMRSRFFENVVGDQALKSARAAAKQAQRSGNLLWKSVADGMLAQSYDVQGERDDSRMEWDKATQEGKEAFAAT